MRKWPRNASRFIVGKDTPGSLVAAFYLLLTALLIGYLEYKAYTVKDFAARYGSPSGTFWSLINDFHLLYPRYLETAWRGYVGILVAGLVAYPIGALLPCFRWTARLAEVSVYILLSVPTITVIIFAQAIYGFGSMALYVMAVWMTCARLYSQAFVASKHLNTLQRHGKDFDATVDAAAIDSTRSWAFYAKVLMPELRAHHLQSVKVIAMGVWTSLVFAEALSSDVIGLGEWIINKGRHSTSMDQSWAGSILLATLPLSSFFVISVIARRLGVEISMNDMRIRNPSPPQQ